jgi:hypothetical protein
VKDISEGIKAKRSSLNGAEVVYRNGAWCWADTLEPVSGSRPCPHCGLWPTKAGEDGCLGHLPGVVQACCGHGVEDGYLTFENGLEIEFRLTKLPCRATPSEGWKSIRER